jgi:hypothetical protein
MRLEERSTIQECLGIVLLKQAMESIVILLPRIFAVEQVGFEQPSAHWVTFLRTVVYDIDRIAAWEVH